MLFKNWKPNQKRARVVRIFKYLVYFIMAWVIVHSVVITIDGLTDDYQVSDVAIVLGSKVNEDGSVSARLKARLDAAVSLFNKEYVKNIVVSGGLGKEGYYEAEVMKTYLVTKGISEDAIIVDNQGNNTLLTATNFIKINKEYKFKSAIFVSQFFHLSRTKLIFKKLGFKQIGTLHAEYFEWRDIYSTLREFPAYYYYLLKY